MSYERWASRLLNWSPETSACDARRWCGHPRKRWHEDITGWLVKNDISTADWTASAQFKDQWLQWEPYFARDETL
eukprot:12026309-Karenia_brevis.AAC.1